MGTWNSRGLRGSTLEERLTVPMKNIGKRTGSDSEGTNPITPIKIDKTHHQITLAYFDQKSTVDYIGAVQGIPVCFDAKECDVKTFPLQNVHEHQVKFMEDFEKQGGKAFLLIYYTSEQKFYYLHIRQLLIFWNRAKEGGRKSFRMEELDPAYFFDTDKGYLVPYLEPLSYDLETETEG